MKYHTIKSDRFNTRENGKYATYPIYEHSTGLKVANLECYSEDVKKWLMIADRDNYLDAPFYKTNN